MVSKRFHSIILLFLILFLFEIILHFLSYVSPRIYILTTKHSSYIPFVLDDGAIRYRGDPNFFGHDTNGFRNASMPKQADIITFGDSITYGLGVERSENWPSVLEKFTKRSVYNMSVIGWGTIQPLIYYEEAKSLRPKMIIEAVFLGNDSLNAYDLVYSLNQFPEFKNPDKKIEDEIIKKERESPIRKTLDDVYLDIMNITPFMTIDIGMTKNFKTFNLFMALYNISRATYNRQWSTIKKRARGFKDVEVFESGDMKTLFITGYRHLTINPDDIRFREGTRILLESLKLMNEKAQEDNIIFVVLLIPTKEYTFQKLLGKSDLHRQANEKSYEGLIFNERDLLQQIIELLKSNNINYVDPSSYLQEKVEQKTQLYPITYDPHPNALGHQTIAEFIHNFLQEKNIPPF